MAISSLESFAASGKLVEVKSAIAPTNVADAVATTPIDAINTEVPKGFLDDDDDEVVVPPPVVAPPVAKKGKPRAKPKYAFPIPIVAVVVDLDGTMIDTVGDIATAANRMRASLGFAPLPDEIIKNFVGKGIPNLVSQTLKDVVGEVGATALKVAIGVFERHYEQCATDTFTIYPGVLDGLNALKAAGYRLGCITNKAEKFTLPILEKAGLRDYFEIVVSGDTVAERKPHPLPVLHAAQFFNIPPAQLLMIGDSHNDAKAARAAGSPTFIVTYGYNEGEQLRGLDCDAFLLELPEALKFVKLMVVAPTLVPVVDAQVSETVSEVPPTEMTAVP
jgi:phosphoglycolate phosphatase